MHVFVFRKPSLLLPFLSILFLKSIIHQYKTSIITLILMTYTSISLLWTSLFELFIQHQLICIQLCRTVFLIFQLLSASSLLPFVMIATTTFTSVIQGFKLSIISRSSLFLLYTNLTTHSCIAAQLNQPFLSSHQAEAQSRHLLL